MRAYIDPMASDAAIDATRRLGDELRNPETTLPGGRRSRSRLSAHRGHDAILLPLMMYSDKTQISDKQSMHPIMVGLANMPIELVNKSSLATCKKKAKGEFLHRTGAGATLYHAWSRRKDSPYEAIKVKAYELAGLLSTMLPAVVAIAINPDYDSVQILHAKLGLTMVKSFVLFYKRISARFPTTATLNAADTALREFMKAYNELHMGLKMKDESKVKFHMLSHYRPLVEQFGPIAFQSTQRGEHEHSVSVKPAAKNTSSQPGTIAKEILEVQMVRTAIRSQLRNCVAQVSPTRDDGVAIPTYTTRTQREYAPVQALFEEPAYRSADTTFQLTLAMFEKRQEVTLAETAQLHNSLPALLENTGYDFVAISLSKRVKLTISSPFEFEPVQQHITADYPKNCSTPMVDFATRADGLVYREALDNGVEVLRAGFLHACIHAVAADKTEVGFLSFGRSDECCSARRSANWRYSRTIAQVCSRSFRSCPWSRPPT
ncbi:hypothetical protein BC828DRAFT_372712 [Blastocladiella britannica]|nr:hypothetical protein BC828DRAFT_372712 [Blastocladiella britannica]